MSTTRAVEPLPGGLISIVNRRAVVIGWIVAVTFLLLGLRFYQLQIVQFERYYTQSLDNRLTTEVIPPARGLIYDRKGNLITANKTIQSLEIRREVVSDVDQVINNVRTLITFNENDEKLFRTRLKNSRRLDDRIVLKRLLSAQELADLAVNRFRFPEFLIDSEVVREYPERELLVHVVGSVRQVDENDLQTLDPQKYRSTKFVGKTGIEKVYQEVLHGQIGNRTVEVDVHGRVIVEIDVEPPRRGESITLHLDLDLQRTAWEALGDRRGAVVALDPNTGGILAMVSRPAYDPNEFIVGLDDKTFNSLSTRRDAPLFNRATQGLYPPGSTFKPVVGLAGIAMELIDWETTVYDRNGEFRLEDVSHVFRDWTWSKSGNGGHQGDLDLRTAIYRSSNIFFYHMGAELDTDTFAAFASQFGFGLNTTADIPDAAPGILPTTVWKKKTQNESWFRGENLHFVIGQGYMLVSPLQLATVAMIFANRGTWVRPKLVMSEHTAVPLGESDDNFRIEGVSDDDWTLMIQALEDVVHQGNQGFRRNGVAWAHIGMDIPFRMAGKSGTAQVKQVPQGEEYDETLLSEYEKKHALFWGFAPVDDPKIAVGVVVENGGGGSSIAGPVLRAVIEAYLEKALVQVNE